MLNTTDGRDTKLNYTPSENFDLNGGLSSIAGMIRPRRVSELADISLACDSGHEDIAREKLACTRVSGFVQAEAAWLSG
jgi:hypothetical protein